MLFKGHFRSIDVWSINMRNAMCILFMLCCALSGCSEQTGEGAASFSYNATSIDRGEQFKSALQTFLKENGFIATSKPNIFVADSGGHSGDSPDIWTTGSYKGSKPFFLRYYFDKTPQYISIHAYTCWQLKGRKSDEKRMQQAVEEFSTKLQELADQYK